MRIGRGRLVREVTPRLRRRPEDEELAGVDFLAQNPQFLRRRHRRLYHVVGHQQLEAGELLDDLRSYAGDRR